MKKSSASKGAIILHGGTLGIDIITWFTYKQADIKLIFTDVPVSIV